MPRRLAASCRNHPEGAAWLNRLPEIVSELKGRWRLTLAQPFENEELSCAWVAPVTRDDGSAAVLKIGLPHMESEHEPAGLRFWNGDPTVRLLESADKHKAMLLERCKPGTSLRELPEPEQDLIIAGLLRRLWRPPSPPDPFRQLSVLTDYWTQETLSMADIGGDPGLVREGLTLFRQLTRTAPTEVLLATDLHAGNVLRAEREPWLVIDPKPFIGDPAYDATQHLFNCCERLQRDPGGIIRRIAGLLEVDPERVRLWTFARAAAEPRDNWKDNELMAVARTLAS